MARPSEEAARGIIDDVRYDAYRAVRWVGTFAGLPAVLAINVMVFGLGRPRAPTILADVLFAGILAFLWLTPRDRYRSAIALVIPMMAATAFSYMWSIGPSFSAAAGLAAALAFSAVFFGRTVATVTAILELLILAFYGWSSVHEGRIGVPGLWQIPAALFVQTCVAYAAWATILTALLASSFRGLRRSSAALIAALESERAERAAREAAERAIAQSRRLEAIEQLASGVAHDTNNALAILVAGLDVLEGARDVPPDPALLADMNRALDAAAETVRQIKVLSGGQGAPPRMIEAAAAVQAFARAFRRVAPDSVQLRTEALAPGRVLVAEALLDQALLNLCLNARDAMPQGGEIRLRVTAMPHAGHDALAIEVADNGPGLPPQVRADLFKPGVTTKEKGSGLGLSQVLTFARTAGGDVLVGDEPGGGTCFRIVVPLCS